MNKMSEINLHVLGELCVAAGNCGSGISYGRSNDMHSFVRSCYYM